MGGGLTATLLIRHPGCPRGIAVLVTRAEHYFSSTGQLRGGMRLSAVRMGRQCDGLVLLGGGEWEGLQGEEGRRLFVQQRVQEVLDGVGKG